MAHQHHIVLMVGGLLQQGVAMFVVKTTPQHQAAPMMCPCTVSAVQHAAAALGGIILCSTSTRQLRLRSLYFNASRRIPLER
jgi:hypothetical protein